MSVRRGARPRVGWAEGRRRRLLPEGTSCLEGGREGGGRAWAWVSQPVGGLGPRKEGAAAAAASCSSGGGVRRPREQWAGALRERGAAWAARESKW